MGAILMRAACFILIIILGHVLRRIGFFKKDDFYVLSKTVLKITLPAAIISNMNGMKIEPSLLGLCLLGFGGGVLYMTVLYLLNLRSSREKRAFEVLNSTGYNIGTFTMPFVQSFLGPAGMLATSLFDTGNSFVCLGGSYSIASMIKGGGKGFSVKKIALTLLCSIPFDTYPESPADPSAGGSDNICRDCRKCKSISGHADAWSWFSVIGKPGTVWRYGTDPFDPV